MHIRVRQPSERLLRQLGTLLILLALIGPLSVHQPAAAQSDDAGEELTELWTFSDLEGEMRTDPLYLDGVVYVTSGGNGTVHALDAESGALLWKAPTSNVSYFKPAVGDGLLITLDHDWETDDSRLIALELDSEGTEERWSIEFTADDGVPTARPFVTADGVVIVQLYRSERDDSDLSEEDRQSASTYLALDSESGSERWRVAGGLNLPGVVSGTIFIVPDQKGATSQVIDIRTGEVLNRIGTNGDFWPLFHRDGTVYGVGFEEVIALDLETSATIWRTSTGGYNPRALTHDEQMIYVQPTVGDTENMVIAVDLDTGELQWTSEKISWGADIAVSADGYLYTRSGNNVVEEGLVGLIAFDAETGDIAAHLDAFQPVLAVANGVIYTGEDELVAYRALGVEPDGGAEPGNQQAAGDASLDLAAMALTPWDLADAGLDNYGHRSSEMVFLDGFAGSLADSRGIPEEEIRDELEDAGFIRAYYAYFSSPLEEEDTDQLVVTYVLEFEDEAGAADAWEFLEDEAGNDDAEDLDGFDDVGDDSEATLEIADDLAQTDATFRLGNLHAGVALVDWNGEEPDEDLMAELLDYALERVEDGLDAEQPALSNQALRLAGDSVEAYYDLYPLRDGEAVWYDGSSSEGADDTLEQAEDAGQIEMYSVWQRLASWGEEDWESVWYYLSIYRFEDEAAAADWVAGQEAVILANDSFEGAEVEETGTGDGGIIYSAVLATDGFTHYFGTIVQVGDLVIGIDVSSALPSPDDALRALVDEQLRCLEDGCVNPVELSGEIEDFIAEAEDTPIPEDDEETPEANETPDAEETPEAEETEQAAGGPVIYESALYPLAVAYDANEWRFTPEDDPTDDEYEWLTFFNDVSTVWMVADPDFGDDELGDCVEYYIESEGWPDNYWMEPIDELTVEDGRAVATFSLVSPFSLYGYLSVECRPIDSNTVLTIMHYASTDAEGEIPEAEIEKVDELKNGIQTASASDGEADDEDEAGSSSAGESYTSEEWGYTVTWDPEYWTESEAGLEDGVRLGYRFNTLASVTIFRIESDGGDADSCLNSIIEQANDGDDEGESELVAADDLPAPETAADAAGGVYMLGDFATMYFECRPLAEGDGMLRIAFGAPDENWEELRPYLEDILAGIEITTG